MMQKRNLRYIVLISKGILAKWWAIIGKSRVVWQWKPFRLLPLPIGIIGLLVIMVVVPLTFTPNTSAAFPYIPPPEGSEGYYIQVDALSLSISFLGAYGGVEPNPVALGKSVIFKNVKIEEFMLELKLAGNEPYLYESDVIFYPKDTQDLKKLKVGDKVDIIGVCEGLSEEYKTITIVSNCQFLPAGLVPLPLPGGPAPISGLGY